MRSRQGTGSGCSAWVDRPAWQTDTNRPGRMVADVTADVDPQTGPAIYVTDTPDLEGLPAIHTPAAKTGLSAF